ncbi:peptide-N4-(N-acetyl-beta-glucosaminyl)asparagine amidase A [Artemisia annua]|uniref:Peptide-N4-(N-acetyl-beta-glucosaminyl)asparagine amidase A n=1 Tax=Artemisia annua TaxID=35608 RepID=A0A2U1LB03_ARTAN|nr:peptide-N4-(N-acetyl-beta-glucosaminyl)asparagine amidase A [Artemisia annua]
MNACNLILILTLFFTLSIQSSLSFEDNTTENQQHYFELTHPLVPDTDTPPSCSVNLLNHTFTNTSTNTTFTVNYTPPPTTCKWSHAVLEFQARCNSSTPMHDRVAGVWIARVELLRTSTAQPTENGSFWSVQKDVSKYSSIITTQDNSTSFSVMLETLDNENLTGVYQVNVSMHFYDHNAFRFPLSSVVGDLEGYKKNRKLTSVDDKGVGDMLGLYPYDTHADMIIPISGDEGYWFRIENESDVKKTNVSIDERTYKAVLELYISSHGEEEFWYLTPPDSYTKLNNLVAGKGKGAYREVLVTIDGKLVGTVIPTPVIFTSGINPSFWKPVVAIGAFNHPSYNIDLTPYLGLLLDDKNHSIEIQVAEGGSYWLVDANMHIWLGSSHVQAIVEYEPPSMEIENDYEFEGLEGEFEIEVERSSSAVGLVQSGLGNIITTKVTEEINFKNKLKFKEQGTRIELDQKIKRKTKVKITDASGNSIGKYEIERTYPLKITVVTQPWYGKGISTVSTTVVQERSESFSNENVILRALNHDVNCTGSMLVNGNSIMSGSAVNHQNYYYKDGFGCYSRKVNVLEGNVVADESNSICIE